MLLKNAIVGQSGGPTSAINATLSGVIKECLKSKDKIHTLYGMKNGMEGFLKEDFVDLFSFFESKSLYDLESTPASALGSCRMKLPPYDSGDKIYEKIFDILRRHSIYYFFYIGGNDSMDTVDKLSKYARLKGIEDIKIIGIPKTIDNDLCVTDHTPGFGSSAKFIATVIEEILRDVSVYTLDAVTVIELMGRDAGWLTASASLCGKNGKSVDLIYLPERPFSMQALIEDVKLALKKHPAVVVAVSEGLKYKTGEYVSEGETGDVDAYGHRRLYGTARVVANEVKRQIGCKVRSIELSLTQRAGAHIASRTDINESIRIGRHGVRLALKGKSGVAPIFKRAENKYAITLSSVSVDALANKIKKVPDHLINEAGNNVTQEMVDYLSPLVKGEHYPRYKDGLPIHCII